MYNYFVHVKNHNLYTTYTCNILSRNLSNPQRNNPMLPLQEW